MCIFVILRLTKPVIVKSFAYGLRFILIDFASKCDKSTGRHRLVQCDKRRYFLDTLFRSYRAQLQRSRYTGAYIICSQGSQGDGFGFSLDLPEIQKSLDWEGLNPIGGIQQLGGCYHRKRWEVLHLRQLRVGQSTLFLRDLRDTVRVNHQKFDRLLYVVSHGGD